MTIEQEMLAKLEGKVICLKCNSAYYDGFVLFLDMYKPRSICLDCLYKQIRQIQEAGKSELVQLMNRINRVIESDEK